MEVLKRHVSKEGYSLFDLLSEVYLQQNLLGKKDSPSQKECQQQEVKIEKEISSYYIPVF
jgi:hemerythrin-like domain-containing protein